MSLRTDHGKEFENDEFMNFCYQNGIKHKFFASYTPQQNGVVEKKNRIIQEMTRSLLNKSGITQYFLG